MLGSSVFLHSKRGDVRPHSYKRSEIRAFSNKAKVLYGLVYMGHCTIIMSLIYSRIGWVRSSGLIGFTLAHLSSASRRTRLSHWRRRQPCVRLGAGRCSASLRSYWATLVRIQAEWHGRDVTGSVVDSTALYWEELGVSSSNLGIIRVRVMAVYKWHW
jgi:hypothetical protein